MKNISSNKSVSLYGTLYIVATPIGNLEDITLRALRILKEVNLIAAEDTRHTRKLLSHYNIHTSLTSYHQHNRLNKGIYLIKFLKEGKNVALVSDSGTPGISDPGSVLIQQALAEKIIVTALPGPSAIICGLTLSGLPIDGFLFLGFLPRKKGKIKKQLNKALLCEKTLIFYESCYRINKTLEIVREVMGEVQTVLARELTKKFEEIIRGEIDDVIEKIKERSLKGELVVLINKSQPK
ncbi:16S rRNA (cytidine(1402)-2'-O)-methyltransferase [bacterium]|nr:16S rRNA (cytidine(1402)-2'-O)-methyltransferase [bacterium]